jgi:hypothetical protein
VNSLIRSQPVLVGLNRRFLSSTQAALQDLSNRDAQRYIHVQDQQSFATAAKVGHPQQIVDNWMYANLIHLIDYLRLFGRGAVTHVVPLTRWDPGTTAVHLVQVNFESGDIRLYKGLWQGPGPWAVSVSTPEKRWKMRPLERVSYQNAGNVSRMKLVYPRPTRPSSRVFACRPRPQLPQRVASHRLARHWANHWRQWPLFGRSSHQPRYTNSEKA